MTDMMEDNEREIEKVQEKERLLSVKAEKLRE